MMLLSLLALPALGDNSGLDRQWAGLAGVCSGPAPPVPTIVSIQAARAEGARAGGVPAGVGNAKAGTEYPEQLAF